MKRYWRHDRERRQAKREGGRVSEMSNQEPRSERRKWHASLRQVPLAGSLGGRRVRQRLQRRRGRLNSAGGRRSVGALVRSMPAGESGSRAARGGVRGKTEAGQGQR